jgi:uncharacterized protein (DUF2461 family)
MKSAIKSSILNLCEARALNSTICPSEVARALWPNDWREHMNDVREAGLALARENKIEITQRGVPRDPNAEIRGAIRYRLKRDL